MEQVKINTINKQTNRMNNIKQKRGGYHNETNKH